MIYRQTTSDFRVEERLLFEPCGTGDFFYVEIEKEGLDSAAILQALRRAAGCSVGEVGMAGRKDRWAVTSQWFSFPAPSGFELRELELDGVRVLRTDRHTERLRVGQLQSNRFLLMIGDVNDEQRTAIEARAAEIKIRGFANRFGHQRFGRRGDNAAQGRDVLQAAKLPRDRRAARFMVSALQSEIFNTTLRLRQDEIGLASLVTGDLALDHRASGFFWIDSGEAAQERADRLELSPTGPLFGDKMRRPFADAVRWERQALAECEVDESMFRSRRGFRIAGTRRSLRAIAEDLEISFEAGEEDSSVARVDVSLGPGSYASVLLEELCGPGLEEGQPGADQGPAAMSSV